MIVTNVRETEGGGYLATIDGIEVAFPAGGDLQPILEWIEAGGVPVPYVAPTQAELLASRRVAARARIDHMDEAALRAVVIESLAYANEMRAKFNTLLQWLGTQTTLVGRGQLAAMTLPQATTQQAKQRIKGRIDGGEADG